MTSDQTSEISELFLLFQNSRRGSNVGPFLRCASAFGVRTIIVVGNNKVAVEGSHGASKHVRLIPFPTIERAIEFLRSDCYCTNITGLLGAWADSFSSDGYGVTLDDEKQLLRLAIAHSTRHSQSTSLKRISFPVASYPFKTGNTCIVFGKHAQGLSTMFSDCCTSFIHVPHECVRVDKADLQLSSCHYSSLLDAQSCLSIVLHRYTQWAQYDEHNFGGHKFEVANINVPLEDTARLLQKETRESNRRDNDVEAESVIDNGLEGLFGS
ncbi:hypothetical protein MPSEU_000491800 [Mayamaea pseudoterrestris]|nr:hypothetical protein MPSEU_000491800 [Mayamaea pseudoterrestris]